MGIGNELKCDDGVGPFIINGYNKLLELPIMVVVVNKNITLNVYMASDILKLPYKEIYKKVRKLLKIR